MKKSELMTLHRNALLEVIQDAYTDLMRYANPTNAVYRIYLWSDGEVERLLTGAGSSEWLQPKAGEERSLDYVCTVRGDDVWQWLDMSEPDDEAEADRLKAEAVKELCSSYDPDPVLDQAIREAKDEERYQ